MQAQPVESSLIRAVAYDASAKSLYVEFVRSPGVVYQYHDVEADVYQALVNAPSVGKYFLRNIRGVYTFSKVSAADIGWTV